MEVSVRELKNNLSLYLRRVQAGEEIIVTSKPKPFDGLTPCPWSGQAREERLWERRIQFLGDPAKKHFLI